QSTRAERAACRAHTHAPAAHTHAAEPTAGPAAWPPRAHTPAAAAARAHTHPPAHTHTHAPRTHTHAHAAASSETPRTGPPPGALWACPRDSAAPHRTPPPTPIAPPLG